MSQTTASLAGVSTPAPARPSPDRSPTPAAAPRDTVGLLVSLFLHALVVSLALVFLTPMVWAIGTSLKSADQFNRAPLAPPHPVMWTNFIDALAARNWAFLLYVLNTVVITQIVVVGTVLSSSLVAYGFARFDFRGKKILFALVISTMLLPGMVTQIPVFLIWKRLGLVDTLWPLVIPSFLGGGAFNIFLLRQFYMTLPRSLDEAAEIDGCTPFGIWWRILMPLSKPALITVGLFAFTGAWQDFMGPLIYLQDIRKYTVSVGLQFFNDEYGNSNLPLLMASSLLHIAPVVLLFLLAQKYFVRGIATSGLKD